MTKQQGFGIDISNFAGEMTQAKIDGLLASGCTFAIVEYTYPDLFEQQCRALAQAGIKVGAYFFIYWSRIGVEVQRLGEMIDRMQGMTDVQFGWQRPDGTYMPQLWLDFEEDTTGRVLHLPPADTVAWGATFVDLCGGRNVSVGVYTGQYWWQEHAGNDTRFSVLPLFHASQYRTTVPAPFPDFYAGHEYGGWPVPMAWQYRGDVPQRGGFTADLDLEEWEA